MFHALLRRHQEDVVCARAREQDEAVTERLAVVPARLAGAGRFGPAARP